MTTPKIKGLGIMRERFPTNWKAHRDVEGVGWLEACGTSLVAAMEALQALVARRVATHVRWEQIRTEET